jgi:hypothetical protein
LGSIESELACRPAPKRNWARWLVPDVALCLAAVTLFYCLFLFQAPQKLFRDSDAGWHIVTGETMIATRALPRSDPYSFTKAGQAWLDWEWASDLLTGLAFRADGLSGVVFIYCIAIAAVTWLWFRWNWAVGGNFLFACVLAAPMLSTTNLHWLARPHIFSWILLLVLVRYFETVQLRFRARDAVFMGALTAIWANVHGSFFLAPAIAVLYAFGHFVRPLIWNLDTRSEWARMRWFGWAALCGLAGSLVNPYGIALHTHVIRYLLDTDLLDRVAEFQSFNFHVDGSFQILLMLGISAGGGVLALTEKKVGHFLLAALFLWVALRSARGLPVAALVLLPIANGAITDALRRTHDWRSPVRHGVRAFLQYTDRLRLLDARLGGLPWAPFCALLAFGWLHIPLIHSRTGFDSDDFPVITAGELVLLPQDARILAPDKYGGYLIYRFGGARKVFFDGRSDFYGGGFMKNYIRLMEVRPGWRELVEAFGFTHALLPVDYSLVPALEGIGWKPLFQDEVAVLLQRPGEGRQTR